MGFVESFNLKQAESNSYAVRIYAGKNDDRDLIS